MRSKEDIEIRLIEAESQLEYLKNWVDKAAKKYQKDKQFWGKEADDGELMAAQDAYGDVLGEIKLLKWILSK